ncbi:hypothetical protein, partial [Deinococcus arenicola]
LELRFTPYCLKKYGGGSSALTLRFFCDKCSRGDHMSGTKFWIAGQLVTPGEKPAEAVSELATLETQLREHLAAQREKHEAELSEREAELSTRDSELSTLKAERDSLSELSQRTADAVLARQAYLSVPRATDEHPNGQVLPQAVAQGFDDLHTQVQTLEAELAQARAGALPADARQRLIDIPGVAEKLADKILAALA